MTKLQRNAAGCEHRKGGSFHVRIPDHGVWPQSFMDFSIPSEFARNALYFSPQFGHFICDSAYHVERSFLDQYLLLYVCTGALHIRYGGIETELRADQIGLLDCRQPHAYWCEDSVDFHWFHFNGCSSRAYTDYLYQRFGYVHTGPHVPPLREHFITVIRSTSGMLANEHQISAGIHSILSGLATPRELAAAVSSLLEPAIRYIHSHFAEELRLDLLAEQCRVSKSHLIRCFQRYVSCTPHEYLLQYRLRQAKHLLSSTDATVEQIAERCGFNSASHFTRAFRQSNGMPPSVFRTIRF